MVNYALSCWSEDFGVLVVYTMYKFKYKQALEDALSYLTVYYLKNLLQIYTTDKLRRKLYIFKINCAKFKVEYTIEKKKYIYIYTKQ